MFQRLLWHDPQAWPVAAIIIAAAVVVVTWLYPPQVRQLPHIWRWTLPGLRALAVAALAISLLKPAMVRPPTPAEQGPILILVDHSMSMSVRDTGRSPAQLVALAQSLRLLPPRPQTQLLSSLQSSWQALRVQLDELILARSALDYAKLTSHGLDAARERLRRASDGLDHSLRAQLEQAQLLEDPSDLSQRYEQLIASIARQEETPVVQLRRELQQLGDALSQRRLDVDQSLYESDELVRERCDELMELSRFQLIEKVLLDPQAGLVARLSSEAPVIVYGLANQLTPITLVGGADDATRLPLAPTAAASDLLGGVRALRDRTTTQPMQAVLLFSDGRQTGGDPKVREPVNLGVPVFTIATGAPIARDLSIARWSVAPSHFAAESTTLRADIRGIGFRGQTVDVHLRAGDQLHSRHVTFDTSQFVTLEFPLRFDRGGVQLVELTIEPQPGEATRHNNRVEQLIKVHEAKLRVLALAGHTSREFTTLVEALQRVPSIELSERVLHRDLDRSELSPWRIAEHDVVLLSDVRREQLDSSQWRAIHQLTSEIGGSAIVIASYPGALRDYAGYADTQPLLPYREGLEPVWRSAPGREARFRLAPAAGAEDLDALGLADDPVDRVRRWDELPAMFHFVALPELKAGVRPLLVERESAAAVMTEHAVGAGRVLFFGASETWRWQPQAGDGDVRDAGDDHQRFWRQLVRYAAEEPYAVDAGQAALDVEQLIVEPDQPLRVRARIRGDIATPPILHIIHDGQTIRTQPLGQAAYGPGRYGALVTGLPAGDYELRLEHRDASDLPPLPVRVEQSLEAEMRILSGDDVRLSQIAAASGGEMLRLDEIDQLPAKLDATRHRRTRLIERSLWDSWHLFAFVLGCLGTEWALRKRFGLA